MQKTTFPVRICIFEDASTDRTAEIVKEYADKYPGLIFAFCQKENTWKKGEIRRKARNPFNEVRNIAKYIALCEGDDYWTDPLKLQKQVGFMEKNLNHSMCFHNVRILDVNNLNRREGLYLHLENRDYSGKEILSKWTVPTASVLYRTELLPKMKRIKRHPNIMYGDIFLFLSMAEFGKIRCINEEMGVYRIHSNSITNKDNSTEHSFRFIKHQKALQQSFGGKYKNLNNEVIARSYLLISQDFFKERQFLKSVKYGFLSLYYSPLAILRIIRHKVFNK